MSRLDTGEQNRFLFNLPRTRDKNFALRLVQILIGSTIREFGTLLFRVSCKLVQSVLPAQITPPEPCSTLYSVHIPSLMEYNSIGVNSKTH